MKSLPLGIAQWVPGPFTALGTDGFGLSESRPALRAHFEVSAEYIAYAALAELAELDLVSDADLNKAAKKLGIARSKLDPAVAGPAQVNA